MSSRPTKPTRPGAPPPTSDGAFGDDAPTAAFVPDKHERWIDPTTDPDAGAGDTQYTVVDAPRAPEAPFAITEPPTTVPDRPLLKRAPAIAEPRATVPDRPRISPPVATATIPSMPRGPDAAPPAEHRRGDAPAAPRAHPRARTGTLQPDGVGAPSSSSSTKAAAPGSASASAASGVRPRTETTRGGSSAPSSTAPSSPSAGGSQPIRAISMKTPADPQLRPVEKKARDLPHVQLRKMSDAVKSQQPQNLGNLAPPYDPAEARARTVRDYVLWGSLAVMLASVIALVVWVIAT